MSCLQEQLAAIRGRTDVAPEARPPRPVDLSRLANAVREMLDALGEDPEREGLRDTPERVARSYTEILSGLLEDPAEHLGRTFENHSRDLVTLSDIEFTSLCEHHLLPVIGTAHIAYLPSHGRVVGLSKLARTVDVFARRPQLQERMTAQIADAIVEHLDPLGVLVLVEARHLCLSMRGAKKRASAMRTVASRGLFEKDTARERQVLALLGSGDPDRHS